MHKKILLSILLLLFLTGGVALADTTGSAQFHYDYCGPERGQIAGFLATHNDGNHPDTQELQYTYSVIDFDTREVTEETKIRTIEYGQTVFTGVSALGNNHVQFIVVNAGANVRFSEMGWCHEGDNVRNPFSHTTRITEVPDFPWVGDWYLEDIGGYWVRPVVRVGETTFIDSSRANPEVGACVEVVAQYEYWNVDPLGLRMTIIHEEDCDLPPADTPTPRPPTSTPRPPTPTPAPPTPTLAPPTPTPQIRERNTVTIRTYLDYRCDGFFKTGIEVPIANTLVKLNFPDGSQLTSITNSNGMATFSGFFIEDTVTVGIVWPDSYRGYLIEPCYNSPTSLTFDAGDFFYGYRFVTFRAKASGEAAGP